MADTQGKRQREARKRRKKEIKAEKKVKRKEDGPEEAPDLSGYFWGMNDEEPKTESEPEVEKKSDKS